MDPHPQEYKAEVSTLAVASWVEASAEPLPGCIAANSSDARARVSGLRRSASQCGAARARTREWSPPLRVVARGGCSFGVGSPLRGVAGDPSAMIGYPGRGFAGAGRAARVSRRLRRTLAEPVAMRRRAG